MVMLIVLLLLLKLLLPPLLRVTAGQLGPQPLHLAPAVRVMLDRHTQQRVHHQLPVGALRLQSARGAPRCVGMARERK